MKYFPVLAIALLLGGCNQDKDMQKTVVSVKVTPARLAEVRTTVTAPATIFPREQAKLSSRITAHISELRVRKGDRVAKGQVLAVLENRDLLAQRDEARAALSDAQASLQKISAGTLPADVEKARGEVISAEAALNQARQNYAGRSELYKQGAIPGRELLASQTDFTQAKASYDVAKRALDLLEHQSREQDIRIGESRVDQAKARLAMIETQLLFAEIHSPFAGTVTEQFMYPGDLAKPEAPLFTVMDLAVAVARAQVPESQTRSAKIGQPCSFASVDAPGIGRDGRITVINQAIDPATRTVEMWCEIPNAARKLPAGAFGNVTIITGIVPDALVVPIAAIQFAEGTHSGFTYVVDSKRVAHRVEVETGERFQGNVQVTKGLNAGDLVIVEGGYGLPDSAPVRVVGATQ